MTDTKLFSKAILPEHERMNYPTIGIKKKDETGVYQSEYISVDLFKKAIKAIDWLEYELSELERLTGTSRPSEVLKKLGFELNPMQTPKVD